MLPATTTPAQQTASGYSVWISKLTLTKFRNYVATQLSLDNKAVVVTGANGAGKSNLLEAVSLFAPGRGMRRAPSQDLAYVPNHAPHPPQAANDDGDNYNDNNGSWALAADIMTPHGTIKVGTGQDCHETRRLMRLDGNSASQSELAARMAVSWLTPDMDGVLAASAGERRRFLDRLVIAFDAAHAGRLNRYGRSMQQRNKILEEGGEAAWLDAVEQELATTGVAICAARLSLVAALDEEAARPQPVFPSARLSLSGEVEEWLADMPAIDVEERVRSLAAARRNSDAPSMPGPHNSLFTASHSATGRTAQQSSTGELKSLLISIILAHARLQASRLTRPPILLLDDITAHLDEGHRAALFDLTADLAGQVWFTATDAGLFRPIKQNACMLVVEAGCLSA